jgi:energy-converting hydrogenase A subunit B
MVLAIVTIQGLHHPLASKLLGKIAEKMGRHTDLT